MKDLELKALYEFIIMKNYILKFVRLNRKISEEDRYQKQIKNIIWNKINKFKWISFMWECRFLGVLKMEELIIASNLENGKALAELTKEEKNEISAWKIALEKIRMKVKLNFDKTM